MTSWTASTNLATSVAWEWPAARRAGRGATGPPEAEAPGAASSSGWLVVWRCVCDCDCGDPTTGRLWFPGATASHHWLLGWVGVGVAAG